MRIAIRLIDNTLVIARMHDSDVVMVNMRCPSRFQS